MKHLLNGVAIAAVLAIAAPVWAQNPSGGNAVGTPGPNPGGPGLTPYSGGAPPAAPAATPAPAMPPSAEAPPPPNSAQPPMHRHARAMHARHHMTHGHMMHGPTSATDTTAQLNRDELARVQSGNMGNPPPPAGPEGSAPQSMGRMPGPKTSGASGAGPR